MLPSAPAANPASGAVSQSNNLLELGDNFLDLGRQLKVPPILFVKKRRTWETPIRLPASHRTNVG